MLIFASKSVVSLPMCRYNSYYMMTSWQTAASTLTKSQHVYEQITICQGADLFLRDVVTYSLCIIVTQTVAYTPCLQIQANGHTK